MELCSWGDDETVARRLLDKDAEEDKEDSVLPPNLFPDPTVRWMSPAPPGRGLGPCRDV